MPVHGAMTEIAPQRGTIVGVPGTVVALWAREKGVEGRPAASINAVARTATITHFANEKVRLIISLTDYTLPNVLCATVSSDSILNSYSFL